ncbi:MAG: hypothetical protein H8D87_19945 [Deltaproteobacteria bacterium]|nr:hypothetical protein [Candidatus Desulfobacula maris]
MKGEPSAQTFDLATSGGLYIKESQPPYDTVSIHGDISFRELPKTVRQKELGIAHPHYDHSLAEQDINIIFPSIIFHYKGLTTGVKKLGMTS